MAHINRKKVKGQIYLYIQATNCVWDYLGNEKNYTQVQLDNLKKTLKNIKTEEQYNKVRSNFDIDITFRSDYVFYL